MSTMTELAVTPRRRNGLQAVADGRVTYDHSSALYSIDGDEVGNWDRRTLAELEGVGLILITKDGKVTITQAGQMWLKANEPGKLG